MDLRERRRAHPASGATPEDGHSPNALTRQEASVQRVLQADQRVGACDASAVEGVVDDSLSEHALTRVTLGHANLVEASLPAGAACRLAIADAARAACARKNARRSHHP
jgi:hypothetical protein